MTDLLRGSFDGVNSDFGPYSQTNSTAIHIKAAAPAQDRIQPSLLKGSLEFLDMGGIRMTGAVSLSTGPQNRKGIDGNPRARAWKIPAA